MPEIKQTQHLHGLGPPFLGGFFSSSLAAGKRKFFSRQRRLLSAIARVEGAKGEVRHAEANIWFSVDMPLRILHIAISDS
jgi:hypothetical protein